MSKDIKENAIQCDINYSDDLRDFVEGNGLDPAELTALVESEMLEETGGELRRLAVHTFVFRGRDIVILGNNKNPTSAEINFFVDLCIWAEIDLPNGITARVPVALAHRALAEAAPHMRLTEDDSSEKVVH